MKLDSLKVGWIYRFAQLFEHDLYGRETPIDMDHKQGGMNFAYKDKMQKV